MSSRLVVDVSEKEDTTYVRLSGIINEDNDLAEFTKKINKRQVIINTADVDRINSCGVRDWVTWLNELEKKNADIFLVECSPAIMTQVNLVNNFVGSGSIVSFYAPYFCAACDTDKMLLIETEEAQKQMPFRPPACRCNQCDHTMEFDDIENSYFAFLSTLKKKNVTPEVTATIKQFSDESNSSGKLRARTSSIPIQTSPSGNSATTSNTVQTTPTTPSYMDLKGLLSESVSFPPPQYTTSEPSSSTNKILFFIIGLLVVAIGLLGYVVIRAS